MTDPPVTALAGYDARGNWCGSAKLTPEDWVVCCELHADRVADRAAAERLLRFYGAVRVEAGDGQK